MSSKQEFNFEDPFDSSQLDNDYLQKNEQEIITRTFQHPPKRRPSRAWGLVLILFISLGVLSAYTINQQIENQEEIDLLQNAQVAGAQDEVEDTVISGDSFSLVISRNIPGEFSLSRSENRSELFEDRPSVSTEYTTTNKKAGLDLTNGIGVTSSPYDNQYDQNSFEEQVLENLGNDYRIVSENITLPKNIKATKIESIDSSNLIDHYVVVTEENYYVIKIYNQSLRYSEFSETTEFTNSLLEYLYLN